MLLKQNLQRYAHCAAIALLLIGSLLQANAKNGIEIVVVPVTNMYSHPSDKSDVVSQAMYGNNVTLLVAKGEWSRIQTSDRYKGWVPSRHLRIVLNGDGYATSGPVVQVDSLFANIYNEPDITKHKPAITVPFETLLEVAVTKDPKNLPAKPAPEGWIQVRLPVMRTGWIQAGDVIDPRPLSIAQSIDLAKRFLGIPYVWGGRSSYGFDCSGFTQMLVRVRGISMPRDADQQAAWKGVVAVDRKDLQAGDLLFFGSSAKQITHTGMYIGEGQFIQATSTDHPVVQISRLDDDPWTHLLVACRRVKQR